MKTYVLYCENENRLMLYTALNEDHCKIVVDIANFLEENIYHFLGEL